MDTIIFITAYTAAATLYWVLAKPSALPPKPLYLAFAACGLSCYLGAA